MVVVTMVGAAGGANAKVATAATEIGTKPHGESNNSA